MKIELNQVFRFVHRSQLDPKEEHDGQGFVNLNYIMSDRGHLSPGNVGRPMFWHRETKICCPVMCFHSNPFKTDRSIKPWIDVLLPDEGLVYYNGDNKTPGLGPTGGHNSGNGMMERLWDRYASHDPEVRAAATPIFIFEHASEKGSNKGYRKFCGYGIVTNITVKQEYDDTQKGVFSNYLFEVTLFKTPPDGVDWRWIIDRRNPNLKLHEINRHAPEAWKIYIDKGLAALERIQQKIKHYETIKPFQQRSELKNTHKAILDCIVQHYPDSTTKGRFEALAMLAAHEYFGEHFTRGWVTQHSGDMGVDFVGRLDLKNHFAPSPAGTVLGKARMLVLGQAKCRTNYMESEESARDITRVAARLQRGYIGVYVTTGTYKESTQREVVLDQYPIVLINGRQLADLIAQYGNKTGLSTKEILMECDDWYKENQKPIPPHIFLQTSD